MKNNAPIIISRKRGRKKHAHHGGTWKIAYADFMTAMMAFFLVMWLLSQSSEMDKQQIAGYFSAPLNPALAKGNRTSLSDSVIPGGGADPLKQDGEVKRSQAVPGKRIMMADNLRHAKRKLQQMIETDPRLNSFKSNLLLTLTNDGLLIQITDSQQRPMFRLGSEMPESYMDGILQAMVPLLKELPNKISLTGHTDALPYSGGVGGYSNWELSAGRANAVRRVLVNSGLNDDRILRVIGTGSQMPLEDIDKDDPRNRRISILVLSRTRENEIMAKNALMQNMQADNSESNVSHVQGFTDGN
ncbi:flagellar motor protein MotB [Pantoea agglomerans]|uniref:flagellar motor protein MotB n=1 Tax=Enterobacter agglomerans TaxID=549 RepID=UPI0010443E9E|nr:flagellar motor protein MotB [Pantoea agglomerans]TCZ24252.1 motility protein MotB [Pantoea agglomerans]